MSVFSPAAVIAAPQVFEVKTLASRAATALPGSLLESALYVLLAVVWIVALLALTGLALIYLERKIAGHFQCRLGPMRVGPHGIFQTVADTIKLLVKEDFVPDGADKVLHVVAPFLALTATILLLVILPLSPILQAADMNIGVVYVTAISGFGVMGILLGGWSSNNKWSMIGAMRAGAQIISYEISATLALLVVVLFAGTLRLSGIVQSQADGWWIWRAHGVGVVAFVIYVIASTAEINRTPFDIPEGESELAAGFHTEYSGIRFAFFFLAEFINMFLVAGFAATFFWGGWMPFHVGGLDGFNSVMDLVPAGAWFAAKTSALVFLVMWFRWTFPRLRVDQMMRLEWKILLPVGFVNLFAAALVVLYGLYFFPGT
ncbi:MAG: NADH-quinone oxidoreductase subunit NuoH [Deltaproteobacteria bacterium]|nr:NADH-quinone oxidoreductase subunit NuoH [Deltaproteobacteria bacterium]